MFKELPQDNRAILRDTNFCCSAVTFSEPPQESSLYGAYVGTDIGIKKGIIHLAAAYAPTALPPPPTPRSCQAVAIAAKLAAITTLPPSSRCRRRCCRCCRHRRHLHFVVAVIFAISIVVSVAAFI